MSCEPIEVARKLAKDQHLDVVYMTQNPPTVRIMNYTKFILKNTADQHALDTKRTINDEIKAFTINPSILSHDLERKIERFTVILKNLYKVQVEIPVENETEDLMDRALVIADNIKTRLRENLKDGIESLNIQQNKNSVKMYITPLEKMSTKEINKVVEGTEVFKDTGNEEYLKRARKRIKSYEDKKERADQEFSDEEETMNSLLDERNTEMELKDIESHNSNPKGFFTELNYNSDEVRDYVDEYGNTITESNDDKIAKILGVKLSYNIKKGRVKF